VRTPAPEDRGFTLVELLVVVAVIGVLAAMILSTVASAREKGQAAQCTNNLRQLALAAVAYAAEHDGQYVPAQESSNNVRWHGVRNGTGEPFDPQKGPLAQYLGSEGRVKLCPTFREILKGSDTFEEGTGGYGYNATYIGGTPADPFQPERIANVPRAAGTVMFSDCAFARAAGVQEYAFCEPWRWANPNGKLRGKLIPSVHFRHSGRANVAWCDGHVSSEEPSELGEASTRYGSDSAKWKIGWFGPREENGYWNPQREVTGHTRTN
jgi:prepilin-type N-terminal cleavage/methylation domain-containing protein/prepilin-type processing-associated H-X9-DG protein